MPSNKREQAERKAKQLQEQAERIRQEWALEDPTQDDPYLFNNPQSPFVPAPAPTHVQPVSPHSLSIEVTTDALTVKVSGFTDRSELLEVLKEGIDLAIDTMEVEEEEVEEERPRKKGRKPNAILDIPDNGIIVGDYGDDDE